MHSNNQGNTVRKAMLLLQAIFLEFLFQTQGKKKSSFIFLQYALPFFFPLAFFLKCFQKTFPSLSFHSFHSINSFTYIFLEGCKHMSTCILSHILRAFHLGFSLHFLLRFSSFKSYKAHRAVHICYFPWCKVEFEKMHTNPPLCLAHHKTNTVNRDFFQ